MRPLPKEAWRYAILLVVLLAIATVTVWEILGHIKNDLKTPEAFPTIAFLIAALTLGFMLIAGAFGLWAIHFSAEGESRRRIGMLVESMDYLSDGLITLDTQGRVTAFNPAAARLVGQALTVSTPLPQLFPSLSGKDIATLLDRSAPSELECSVMRGDAVRTLRLRSQPSSGLTCLLVSDITAMAAQQAHRRQLARLQLIGQIARGVAHDFNNLLCVVSGQASLLARHSTGVLEARQIGEEILRSTERGVALSNHLLDLAQSAVPAQFTDAAAQFVNLAVEVLKDTISDRWKVDCSVASIPTVALTGLQIEQIVLNLGYLCVDAQPAPGVLSVSLSRPGHDPSLPVGGALAGVLRISAQPSAAGGSGRNDSDAMRTTPESGVILSVLRSMVEEPGGFLESLPGPGGLSYRVGLPLGTPVPASSQGSASTLRDLIPYLRHWSVLVAAASGHTADTVERRLRELTGHVERASDVLAVLGRVSRNPPLDGIVVDKNLLQQESESLLRAMATLAPGAGIVALSETPQNEPRGLTSQIVFVDSRSDPESILLALVDAHSLAKRRQVSRTEPARPS